jgi:hypothetical protein
VLGTGFEVCFYDDADDGGDADCDTYILTTIVIRIFTNLAEINSFSCRDAIS